MIIQNSLNDNGNLFGGFAMQWMDEVAYITAIRFTRMKVVTVSVDRLKFRKAIKPGSMVEIIGKVIKVGTVKIDIKVEVFVEKSDSDQREKAVEATFTFAAINKDNKPVCIDKDKWIKIEEKDSETNSVMLGKSMVYLA
jgi:acyl-CoA hydrolase